MWRAECWGRQSGHLSMVECVVLGLEMGPWKEACLTHGLTGPAQACLLVSCSVCSCENQTLLERGVLACTYVCVCVCAVSPLGLRD